MAPFDSDVLSGFEQARAAIQKALTCFYHSQIG
jgi:hypothetical protein